MKNGQKIIKRALAIFLAFTTIVSSDASNIMTVFAEETPGNAYTLKLNEKECMGTEPVSVAYGEPISLELAGFSGGTVTYHYSKYQTFKDEQENPSLLAVVQNTSDFTKGLELETVYYLGYTTDGGYAEDYTGNHCFQVVPATTASPANVLWDGYAAKWDSVTTDCLNYALDAEAVSGYEVSLYRINSENREPLH